MASFWWSGEITRAGAISSETAEMGGKLVGMFRNLSFELGDRFRTPASVSRSPQIQAQPNYWLLPALLLVKLRVNGVRAPRNADFPGS